MTPLTPCTDAPECGHRLCQTEIAATLRQVVKTLCKFLVITPAQLVQTSDRGPETAIGRQVLALVCRNSFQASYTEIAPFLGYKTANSAIHSTRGLLAQVDEPHSRMLGRDFVPRELLLALRDHFGFPDPFVRRPLVVLGHRYEAVHPTEVEPRYPGVRRCGHGFQARLFLKEGHLSLGVYPTHDEARRSVRIARMLLAQNTPFAELPKRTADYLAQKGDAPCLPRRRAS